MDKLPQQGGVLLLAREDRRFCCQPSGTPEPAGGPVCEGPRNPKLPNQGKNVVILRCIEQAHEQEAHLN